MQLIAQIGLALAPTLVGWSSLAWSAPGAATHGSVSGVRLAAAVAAPATVAPDLDPEAEAPANRPGDNYLFYRGDQQGTNFRNISLPVPLNLVWRHTPEEVGVRELFTSPLVVGAPGRRRIYYAAGDYVFCVDGTTGSQIWRSDKAPREYAAPISIINREAGPVILAAGSGGEIRALNLADGKATWTASARSNISHTAPMLLQTAKGPRIVVAIATGRLIAFNTDGQLDPDWEVRLGRQSSSPSSPASLSPDGHTLYINAGDQRLYAVDLQRGEVLYSAALRQRSASAPLVLGDEIIDAAGDMLFALKAGTGELLWSQSFKSGVEAGAVGQLNADGSGTVYAGSRKGEFRAINANTGDIRWSTNVQASITGTATILPSAVVFGTSNGLLMALRPADGAVLWQYRLHTETVAPKPAPAAGTTPAAPGGTTIGGPGMATGTGTGILTPGTTYRPPGEGGGPFGGGPFPGTGPFGGGMAPAAGTGGEAGIVSIAPAERTMITHSITSAPAVVNGQMFVLGNNGALYAFDSSLSDAIPPEAIQPSLFVLDAEKKPFGQLLDGATPVAIPGKGPADFTVSLDDVGSGVDPASIHVTLNGTEVPAKTAPVPRVTGSSKTTAPIVAQPQYYFYMASHGLLSVRLAASGAANALQDGPYNVEVQAKDYRGNALTYSGSFTVDHNLPAPAARLPKYQGAGEGTTGGPFTGPRPP